MRYLITTALIAASMTVALPAFAQGVYIGPGGVGFDSGAHRGDYRDRGRDREDFRGRRPFEGRSAYDRDNGPRYRDGY